MKWPQWAASLRYVPSPSQSPKLFSGHHRLNHPSEGMDQWDLYIYEEFRERQEKEQERNKYIYMYMHG